MTTSNTKPVAKSVGKAAAGQSARGRAKFKDSSWQAEKSQLTIALIMEATLQCLVGQGYAQTTTEKIAKQAGVSRGAMMHHFKSSAAIIKAAAKYVTEKRATEFEQAIALVGQHTGALPTWQDMRNTMSFLQKYYALPSFVAFHELIRGARTDKSLKKVLAPLEAGLDQKMSEGIRRQFPYWTALEGTREVLTDLITFSLQGVAVDPAPYLEGNRLEHFLDLLATIAMREFTDAYEARQARPTRSGRAAR